MKIVDVTAQPFTYRSQIARDSEGHSHPVPEYDATECLVEISTDEGVSGYCFGGHPAGAIRQVVKPMLVGEDPFYREKLWQRLKQAQRGSKEVLSDRLIGVVDQALWDLAGRALGQPVYKLLGGARDKVPAYASTMCGDEVAGGTEYAGGLRGVRRAVPGGGLYGLQAPYLDAADSLGTGSQAGRGRLSGGAGAGR